MYCDKIIIDIDKAFQCTGIQTEQKNILISAAFVMTLQVIAIDYQYFWIVDRHAFWILNLE